MSPPTSRIRDRFFFTLLGPLLVLIACSSTSGTSSESGDASADSGMCPGTSPITCDGCCGNKYAAGRCVDAAWTCAPLTGACVECDAGSDAAADDASNDSGTCTGTRPNCFGNNSSLCCGNDPSGPATCSGGEWKCGTAPAPGCDGTSCLLKDAGPGRADGLAAAWVACVVRHDGR